METRDFRFGIEAELLLVDARTFRPLWYRDLGFRELLDTLESIPLDDVSREGLRLERPHHFASPFVVEGYHLPDAEWNPIDLLPKGVEIRTPICRSIEGCVASLRDLHGRLQRALAARGRTAVSFSFHPYEHTFRGPQNKRRHDFWQWAMEAMLTYGPDINVGLPGDMFARLDLDDLQRKVDCYVPALTALTVATPLYRGELWRVRGRVGKSVRTHMRSVVAPAIEIHPDQGGRLELKPFEMPLSFDDFGAELLLWLTLLLDERLAGRATPQTRVYDLGEVARFGLEAEGVRGRVAEVLERAERVLPEWGFDPAPLAVFAERLRTGRVPADDIAEAFEREHSVEQILRGRVMR
ncbi:MAG: hypothetical protein HYV09_26095 [Deltaproteobacteria bacterium]|nr:hypothetical protein [Deltaproteobacteria bacterium]